MKNVIFASFMGFKIFFKNKADQKLPKKKVPLTCVQYYTFKKYNCGINFKKAEKIKNKEKNTKNGKNILK